MRKLFREYYVSKFEVVDLWEMGKREYAFQPFQEDIMIRHLTFKDPKKLKEYIGDLVPKHAYYSTALYEDPGAPDMDEKRWLGAELVFDIDADHIPTKCKTVHDTWVCLQCGSSGFGDLESCPNCGGGRVEKYTWVCSECIEEAKNHTVKLVEEFLVADFGINPRKIKVYFSGHRGFHIHVFEEEYLQLGSDERRQIVNYVKGLGLDLENMGISYAGIRVPLLTLTDYGWRGRIARGLYDFLTHATVGELASIFRDPKPVEELVENRDKYLDLLAGGYEEVYVAVKMLKPKNYLRLLEKVVESLKIEVDEKVTIDVKRLIRMPNTLNGKTGLKVVEVDISRIEDFQLAPELSPFQGSAKVRFTRDLPAILELFDEKFKVKRGEVVRTTLPAAVYLTAKEYAELVEVVY